MTKYPRGSTWRRWDLHVHTPASIIQDYGGDTPQAWNGFIDRLKQLPPDVSVLAITDYLFIDGYEKLLARRNEIPNILTLLPNIAFRLDTFSGTASNTTRHNFHVIFDPSVTPHTIREQLLNCLSKGYTIDDRSEWQQTPTVASLTTLGARMKTAAPAGNAVHAKGDLRVGFDSITYKREDILHNLAKDCFKGKYVLGIGYSEWDQARWDQAAAERRTLINTAHFSLISNDDVAKIEQHRQDLETNKLNNLILHSSDSHSLDRLGKTKLWIKADPTFAGLKQVINEPARVFLGDAPPAYKQAHQVIDKIVIPASAGWFANDFALELNDGLVAIIGGRGSGKSALAEMIATAVGERDPSSDSFIRKASRHQSTINGTDTQLIWADGSDTSGEVGVDYVESTGLVKYLPQKAVEDLCSPENSKELVAQIESVIFQALDEASRLGTSDFTELKTQLLTGYHFERNEITNDLKALNGQEYGLTLAINGVPAKKRELQAKSKDLEKLNAELPKLPTEDQKAQNELAALAAHKKLFEDRIVELRKLREQIAELHTKVRVFQSTFQSFATDLLASATAVGITQLDPFRVSFNVGPINQALQDRSQDLQTQIEGLLTGSRAQVSAALNQDASEWTFDNYETLSALVDTKAKETKAFETTKIKFQQQKAKITQTEKLIIALQTEITKLEAEATAQRKAVRDRRFAKYCEYFGVLAAERTEITKLYQPLQAALDQGSDTDRRLRFQAQCVYRLDEHLEKGLAILDRTKRGNFRDVDALRKALDAQWTAFLNGSFDPDVVRNALTGLWSEFLQLHTEAGDQRIEIESQLRDGYSTQDFCDWFLDPTPFDVTSSLTFDDTDLYLLSPGKKGIVLLILYLGMDQADTRPLIIDQPEDNLDNLSVYRDLIGLFRNRKQFRQIILVTHNPNLVVNADAEQVVIATFDGKATPRIEYSSGSLENQAEQIPNVDLKDLADGIIEQVCDVLEGGSGAFSRRSKVYSLSPKIG